MTRPEGAALKVTALDHNGYARQEMPGAAGNIALLPDCLYYVIAKPVMFGTRGIRWPRGGRPGTVQGIRRS